jgi:tetratricopeptide (TPR) repeat protein
MKQKTKSILTLRLQAGYRPKPLNSDQSKPFASLLASGRISGTVKYASSCPRQREATPGAPWSGFLRYRFAALGFILCMFLFTFGCAAKAKISPERTVEFEQESLVQDYLQTGQEYENSGDLIEALKHYRLALTVNPQSQIAAENVNRLKRELRKLAEEHYQAGLRYHEKGRYGAARREFLTTLALWPEHQEAVQRLSVGKRIQAKRYIVHTMKLGESLSELAKMYYGDYTKFAVIAEYNGIADAVKVRVGQEIKVPEIEGIPFLVANQNVDVEEVRAVAADLLKEEKEQEGEGEETLEEPVDVAAMYRNHGIGLFNKGEYLGAIVEFKKVLNVNSDDAIAIDYLYKSHFQQAMVAFAKRDYLSAKTGFEESLRYKTDCRKCHEYIRKSEAQYKELHYTKGLSYFRDEQLVQALEEWELVQAVDPDYKEVEQHINKVRKLLKTLEGIQKSQQEKSAR